MKQKLFTPAFTTILIMNFLLFLGFNTISPTLPIYYKEIGISEGMTGICISIFTVGSILIRPFAGGIIDKHGRRAVFFISMALMALMVYAHAYFTVVASILILRLVNGIDWGFTSTCTSTMATDAIPRHMIGRGMGIFGLSSSLALAISPAMGVALINNYGFETMITVCTLCMVGTLILGCFYPYKQFAQPKPAATSAKKALSKDAMFERTAILPAILMGLVTLTMSAICTYVALFALDIGLKNPGFFFTAYASGVIVVRLFIGALMDRYGIVVTTFPAFVSMLVAIIMLAFSQNITMLLISGILYGAGYGIAQTTMQSLAVMNAPQERFGAANGTFFIGFDIGIGLGTILGGWLIEAAGFRIMYLSLCIFLVIASVLLLKYRPRKLDNVC